MSNVIPVVNDGRPQFNPSRLVQLVCETLAYRYGIQVIIDSVNVGPAVNAAADLLRALHIEPTAVPSAPDDEPPWEGWPLGTR